MNTRKVHIFSKTSKVLHTTVSLLIHVFCKSCEPEIVLAVLQIKTKTISYSQTLQNAGIIKQTVVLLWKLLCHALIYLAVSGKYFFNYRISLYSFRGNYSFLDLGIQRSQYIRPKITVHKCAETIQGRKLYEEMR